MFISIINWNVNLKLTDELVHKQPFHAVTTWPRFDYCTIIKNTIK